jgi:hypothetical protein
LLWQGVHQECGGIGRVISREGFVRSGVIRFLGHYAGYTMLVHLVSYYDADVNKNIDTPLPTLYTTHAPRTERPREW